MGKSFYTSVERYGNAILWRGYENGKSFSRKVKYKPTLFIPSKNKTDWRAFIAPDDDEVFLNPKQFESMSDAKDFIERYSDVEGFKIYGNTNYVAQFIQEHYPEKIDFDASLINILSFDIEVDISSGKPMMTKADKPITSISIKSSKSPKYTLLGLKDYDKTQTESGIDPNNIEFIKFESEERLLRRFVEIWCNESPDIVTGWNVDFFDVAYIVTRIARLFGEDMAMKLSPWGVVKQKSIERFGKKEYSYDIMGIAVIDFMDAFKKFGYKYGTQETYKLDHITHVVLGEQKLDYSEYGSLTELYNQNPQKYLDYSLKDTFLIQRLEDETALISLVLTVAYGGGVNYREAFGTTSIWETTLYRKMMLKNEVPPIKDNGRRDQADIVGGYVKDPTPGIHNWVVTLDLKSLYPHLMLQYNMSPETYSPKNNVRIPDHENDLQNFVLSGKYRNENNNFSIAANGVAFRNDKLGLIPSIIEGYYAERDILKKKMLSVESEIELIKEELSRRKNDKKEEAQHDGLERKRYKL
jgi:DNA polymerase elongation subunit (family B)